MRWGVTGGGPSLLGLWERVVYAGVVGAEMGTPEVGKRLLVEDIEVRDGEEKGATRGKGRDGCQLTCSTCTKRKGKGKKFSKPCESAFSGRVRTRSRGVARPLYE
jgi:hypothetical protein